MILAVTIIKRQSAERCCSVYPAISKACRNEKSPITVSYSNQAMFGGFSSGKTKIPVKKNVLLTIIGADKTASELSDLVRFCQAYRLGAYIPYNLLANIETVLFSGGPYRTLSRALLNIKEDYPGPLALSHRCLYIHYRLKALPVQRRGAVIIIPIQVIDLCRLCNTVCNSTRFNAFDEINKNPDLAFYCKGVDTSFGALFTYQHKPLNGGSSPMSWAERTFSSTS